MLLRELFINTVRPILEGGNVSHKSPGWQGMPGEHKAEEIDLKIHNRDFMVEQLRTLLKAQNEAFAQAYGRPIWDPRLLDSNEMFSGSSVHFFDIKGISTEDFLKKLKKDKVGDIDTQIDQNIGDNVNAWLKSVIGKQVGNGTFVGFNSSLSSIWLLNDPPVKVQVDYELGPYTQPKGKEYARPTDWFRYSHSSEYEDLEQGIKGVFHKYINRAMTHAQSSTKYVARVLKKSVKISDEPVTDSDYSFAVTSSQGGGMSKKYVPYVDPNTGVPMEKDGIPVMRLLQPADRDYIQNLGQQFEINYGHKPSAKETEQQKSFIGSIALMNKSYDPEQSESVTRAFLDILFGPGAQMIAANDPTRDRDIKFAATDYLFEHLKLPNAKALRDEAVQMALKYEADFNNKKVGRAEPLTEAEVVQSKRKGIVHLEKMKDIDFLNLLDEIKDKATGKFHLHNIPMNVKVDGFGGRFGFDENGRPYAETSRSGPKFESGQFVAYAKSKGVTDPAELAKRQQFDDWFEQMLTVAKTVGQKMNLKDVKVHVEVLYLPFAEQQADGRLKFVGISYDQLPKGITMALVPLFAERSSTGEQLPNSEQIVSQVKAIKQVGPTMFIDNRLTVNGELDATAIIPPEDNIEVLRNMVLSGKRDQKREAAEALQQVKDELGQFIIKHPNIVGKDMLGRDYEGIILNTKSGPVKITTPEQKQVIATKNAARQAARAEQPRAGNKTAVVAVGSAIGHVGHQQLFNYTLQKAREVGGDPYMFIGPAEGKDDPIPPSVKVETWHKLYPQYADNISTVAHEGGTLLQKIKHELINPLPGKSPRYDNIIITVGTDRAQLADNWGKALMKAVNKFQGYEHVKVIPNVTGRGEAEGGTGVSGTQLRKVLQDVNKTPEQQFAVWNHAYNSGNFGAQKLDPEWIKHLMNIARRGMGIAEPQANPDQETSEDAAGVGIITKQNSTVDVNKRTPMKNLKKFNLIKESNRVVRALRSRDFVKEGKVTTRSHEEDMVSQGTTRTRDVGGYDRVYHMNRLMMAMAMADGKSVKAVDSPSETWAEKFNTHHPYTKEEDNMVKSAMKTVPTDGKEISKFSKSAEPKDVNKTSPVAKPKRNKYGI